MQCNSDVCVLLRSVFLSETTVFIYRGLEGGIILSLIPSVSYHLVCKLDILEYTITPGILIFLRKFLILVHRSTGFAVGNSMDLYAMQSGGREYLDIPFDE